MSDWKRFTREIPVDQIPGEIRTEIQRHIELYNLGNILSEAVVCIQSNSEKPKKGLFGSAETNRTVAILTPRWLLWVVSGSKTPVTVTSALLNKVVIQDYASSPLGKMMPDSGIQVSGKFTDVTENLTAFIGLESNAAGQKFKELVIAAVQNSKK